MRTFLAIVGGICIIWFVIKLLTPVAAGAVLPREFTGDAHLQKLLQQAGVPIGFLSAEFLRYEVDLALKMAQLDASAGKDREINLFVQNLEISAILITEIYLKLSGKLPAHHRLSSSGMVDRMRGFGLLRDSEVERLNLQ